MRCRHNEMRVTRRSRNRDERQRHTRYTTNPALIHTCFGPHLLSSSSSFVVTNDAPRFRYKTTDFVTWENLGTALPLSNRKPGIEFRPCVVFNAKTGLFVMWYEDRGAGETGYAVATSTTPAGPFTTTHVNVTMPGPGRVGDYNIFVDDDGRAYHVRTGFAIVLLNDDYTGPAKYDALRSTSSVCWGGG